MATLKISELSVGDWVYYDKGNTPYSISGIYRTDRQDCVVLDDKEYADGVIAFVDILTPIPITAEMLVKNGFAKYSEREWGCNDDSPYHTFIHIDTSDETMWFISFPTIFNLIWDHPIYYIHELQHLIRLAGVDKEINL